MNNILAFSGSNSSTSINQELIIKISERSKLIDVIDLKKLNIPLFSIDTERENGVPADIKSLVAQIKKYKKIIMSTPEHNGAMPAFFKNILDWISRYDAPFLEGIDVIILSTSPGGRGAIGALTALENQLKRYTGANIIHKQAIGSYSKQKEENTLNQEIETVLKFI